MLLAPPNNRSSLASPPARIPRRVPAAVPAAVRLAVITAVLAIASALPLPRSAVATPTRHAPPAATATPFPDRAAPDLPKAANRARDAVRRAVAEQLDRLAAGIADHESSRPRDLLLARRMTVETFLIAGLAPQQLLHSTIPDLAAPWRHAFDGTPLRLHPNSAAAAAWRPLASNESGPDEASACEGRFIVEFLHPTAGDDPVAIGGRLLVRPGRVMLAVTWCEPCLSPDAVDFPILPEGFLLEWDDEWRTIRTRLPTNDRHMERSLRKEDPAPLLDQPGDLYDLFDGLRPLPWLLPDRPKEASIDARRGRRSNAPARSDASGMAATPAAATEDEPSWISRGADGGTVQTVTLVDRSPQRLTLLVEQPPVEVTWTSAERYELLGDVLGEPLPTRTLRPSGTAIAHERGTRMVVSVERSHLVGTEAAEGSWRFEPDSADATIEFAGRRVATIRWRHLRRLDALEADRLEASMRHAFESGDAAQAHRRLESDPFVAFDSGGFARRQLRSELRHSIEHGTLAEVGERVEAYLDRLASDDLAPELAVRSIEALEERLEARGPGRDTITRLDLAWRRAIARCDRAALGRLLADRLGQGRFGSAMRLAHLLLQGEDPAASESGPSPMIGDVAGIARRLRELADQGERPAAPWFEPAGRVMLDHRLLGLEQLDRPDNPDSREQLERRAQRDRDEPPVATAAGGSIRERDADAAPPPPATLLIELLDDAIAGSGTWPRPGTREVLVDAVERRTGAGGRVERVWASVEDRRRLAVAMRIFLGERHHHLVAHLRSRLEPSDGSARRPTEFETAFEACLDRIADLGPVPPPVRRAGDREENDLLAELLRAGERLAREHRCGAAASRVLREAIVAISDARRLRRGSVCFPAFLQPLAAVDRWQGPNADLPAIIERTVADDAMLATIAQRIAIEDRLIEADPSTAAFRTAMRAAQIDALATRLDAVVAEAVRGDSDQDGAGRAGSAPLHRAEDELAAGDLAGGDPDRSGAPAEDPGRSRRPKSPARAAAPERVPLPLDDTTPSAADASRFEEIVHWLREGGPDPW